MIYLGYFEASCSIGLMIGPMIGSALYGSFGYETNFYFVSGIFFFQLILIYFLFPDTSINQE